MTGFSDVWCGRNHAGYAPVEYPMAYIVVVLVSVLVGAAAYAATIVLGRAGPGRVAVGFEGGSRPPGDRAEPVDEPGYTYLRVTTSGPTWRDRAQGFIELLALLFVASAALAFGIYQLGHLINLTIERFLAK
jgi:hypothetical protein